MARGHFLLLQVLYNIVKHGSHVCLVHAVLLVAHPVLGLPAMIEDMFNVNCLSSVYKTESFAFPTKDCLQNCFQMDNISWGQYTLSHRHYRKMHRAVHYLLANFYKTRHYFMLNMCHKISWEQLEVLKDIFIDIYFS